MQEDHNQPNPEPRRGRRRHAGPGGEHPRGRYAAAAERPGSEELHGEQGPEGGRPMADHPQGEIPQGERPPVVRPVGDHERFHPGFEGRHEHPQGDRHHPGFEARHERNFWREWRDERHHGHPEDFLAGQALSPKEMEAWREFFHQSFGAWPEDHWIFGGRRFSPWHQGMDTFNPFLANLLSKGGGLLPLYVLHLVAQQPRYGNEIMEILADRTNGQWVSNPGAIYPLLTLIEHEGLISGEWADPAKRSVRIYTITEKGQAELARIKTIVTPKLEETVSVLEVLLQDFKAQAAARPVETGPTQPEGEV